MNSQSSHRVCLECGNELHNKRSDAQFCSSLCGQRSWNHRNRHKVRKYVVIHGRKRRYGLSNSQYEHLVKIQNGLCAICHGDKKLNIDHCHSTGHVRGLLCHGCNTLIGYLERATSHHWQYLGGSWK